MKGEVARLSRRVCNRGDDRAGTGEVHSEGGGG